MKNDKITREYLETLSFSELQKIADDFFVDIVDNYDRCFLIAEILEATNEKTEEDDELENLDLDFDLSDSDLSEDESLPRAYNSTEIEMILRNPAWAYIYWNISSSDSESLKEAFISEVYVRVNCFSEKEQVKPDDYFDMNISKDDGGQYFLLPSGRKFFRVDLLFNLDGIIDILASSKMFEMPEGTSRLIDVHPGKNEDLSPLLKLSGMNTLLMEHYKNHRESFL